MTATAGSRWYVMPAFTTFLVFVMLLVDSPHDAQARFWERVLETAFGVAVAAVVVLLGRRRRVHVQDHAVSSARRVGNSRVRGP